MASKTLPKQKTSAPKSNSTAALNNLILDEISRLAEMHGVSTATLEEFAQFVIKNHKKHGESKVESAPKKPKSLTLPQLKDAVYKHFSVRGTDELKQAGFFKMATSGMGKLDLSKKAGWECLYRKFVGILPGEDTETGYGCINGIDIFKYDFPWKAFGLDSQVATTEEIKSAYRQLSKIYHPDNRETGDARIFDRLTIFYKSLTEKF